MHLTSVVLVAWLSAHVNAIPLNINLGAYSPALVVGDGEISFKGKEDVTALMDALEGAAVSGAAKNGAAGADASADGATGEDGAVGSKEQLTSSGTPLQGMGKGVISGDGSPRIITPLHKEIAPRVTKLIKRDNNKRGIGGFNAALSYATGTLGKNPGVELSTGIDGSGTGIIVNPSGAVTGGGGAPPKAGGAGNPAGAKGIVLARREEASPKTKTTVTTMYVRGGPTSNSGENISEETLEKRDTPSVDGVNLKVADGQVAELTFVETRSTDDSDDMKNMN
ncbi:hypothetical protein K3495_g8680 [Podosphaera aphanis]|nr:hypothetical protein K3495_g8680 [Podosphaera aphanis]